MSPRKNSLDISKRTLYRITKRNLKCHPYKMHLEKRARIRNAVDLLTEKQYLLKIVVAGMRRMQVCLQRNGGLLPFTRLF